MVCSDLTYTAVLSLSAALSPCYLAAQLCFIGKKINNNVTECIVYMFRAIPFNLFFPVLFLFDWVGFLWPNYLRC